MKKLEQLSVSPATEWDARRLSCWLYEWDLICLPDSEDAEAAHTNSVVGAGPQAFAAPVDEEIGLGEIRLLVPRDDDALVFIAIAAVQENGDIVCVPFSRLSEPAMPDELLSGRDTPAVRVFCLWNARTLVADRICNSWIADILTTTELDRLLRALAACKGDGRVPEDLRRDAGPPLVHPLDPRREHRYRERLRIDHALVRERKGDLIPYDASTERSELPKAAEDHDTYEV